MDKVFVALGWLFLLQIIRKLTSFSEAHALKGKAQESTAEVVISGITAGLEVVGGMDMIEQGLNTFMEGKPGLLYRGALHNDQIKECLCS